VRACVGNLVRHSGRGRRSARRGAVMQPRERLKVRVHGRPLDRVPLPARGPRCRPCSEAAGLRACMHVQACATAGLCMRD